MFKVIRDILFYAFAIIIITLYALLTTSCIHPEIHHKALQEQAKQLKENKLNHLELMKACKSICGVNRVQSYEPYTGTCKCVKN